MVASILILALILRNPIGALASARNYLLESGTSVIIRVNEKFKSSNKADNGVISVIVDSDIYSADGTYVLILLLLLNLMPNQTVPMVKQAAFA